jgi:hypothetical protein
VSHAPAQSKNHFDDYNVNVIAVNVLYFFGIRFLVNFSVATSKSNRIAMLEENECRKKHFAEGQHQSLRILCVTALQLFWFAREQ